MENLPLIRDDLEVRDELSEFLTMRGHQMEAVSPLEGTSKNPVLRAVW